MVPRKIKDQYHLRFRKLHKFQQLPKTRVKLILNFTRPHAITYTNSQRGPHGRVGYNQSDISANEIIVLLKTPPKYTKLDETKDKSTPKITRLLTIFAEHGIINN